MAAAYTAAGHSGLIALKVVIVSVALFFVARRLRGCTPAVTATVLGVVVVCMLPTTLTVRPHLWTLLGLVLLLTLLDRQNAPTWSRSVAGALLFGFWANLHGGWITGAAVLAIYTGVRIVTERRHVERWVAFAVVSIAGTLANPYGIGLWRFLAATVRSSRPDVTEWAPLGLASPLILWTPLVATGLVAGALSWRSTTRPRPEVWAALGLLILELSEWNGSPGWWRPRHSRSSRLTYGGRGDTTGVWPSLDGLPHCSSGFRRSSRSPRRRRPPPGRSTA